MLIAKGKLWHYFNSHLVVVASSRGLGDIINNQGCTGRITKWGLELMGLDITYTPRTTIKSQVLTDFVAEWTEEQASTTPNRVEYWTMYFNGSLTLKGAGVGVLLMSPSGDKLRYAFQFHFWVTNNVAEYAALLHGIRVAAVQGAQHLFI